MKFDFFFFFFGSLNVICYPDTFISSLKFLESFFSFEENFARFLSMISFPTAFDFLSFDTEKRVSVDVLLRIFVFNMSFATRFFLFIKRDETVLYEIILNIIISRIIIILILFMGKLLKKKIMLIVLFLFSLICMNFRICIN